MATITKTVGVGGDYATYTAVITYLRSVDPITDNYIFNQISDITQTTTPAAYDVSVGAPGLTVEFNGNGYYLFTSVIGIQISNTSLTPIIYKAHDIKIRVSGSVWGIRFSGRTANGTAIYDCFIYSLTAAIKSIGIYAIDYNAADGGYQKIYNCKFYGLWMGINGALAGTFGPGLLNNARFFENCSMLNCGKSVGGDHGYAISLDGPGDIYIKLRNSFFFHNDGLVGYDVYWGDNTCTINNCGTTDANTFAVLAAAHPGQINNCIDGMVAADEVLSLTYNNSAFLYPKPHIGTGVYNGGIVPTVTVNDYDHIPYGVNGLYPMGALQYFITADFIGNPTNPDVGDDVYFTNTSMSSSGITMTSHWDFGDGETSDEENPIHVYEHPGTYTVTLYITDGFTGDTEIKIGYITVLPLILDFVGVPTSGKTPLRVRFESELV